MYFVNLFNPVTKTSQWLAMNGQAQGIEVKSYDPVEGKVHVVQAGKPLTLTLKQARISLVQIEAPPPPPLEQPEEQAEPEGRESEARRAETRARMRARMGGPGDPNQVRPLPAEAKAMMEEFRRRQADRARIMGKRANPGPGQKNLPVQPPPRSQP